MRSSSPAAPSPDQAERAAELRTRLVWLTFFRNVANTLFLATIAVRLVSAPPRELALADTLSFAGIGAVYLFTLAYALRLRRGRASLADARVQVVVDVLVATGLVFLTGVADSPYTFAFSLAVIEAALVLERRGALFAAGASALAYCLLLWLVQQGLVVSPLGGTLNPARMTFLLVSNTLAVSLVAVLAGYLSRQLSATGGRLEAREEDLRRLGALHQQILWASPSGLLTCDAQGSITFANRAAGGMLARDAEALSGVDLEVVLPGGRALAPHATRSELSVDTPAGRRTLGLSVTPLRQGDGSLLIVFQDLTELRRAEEDLRRADRLAAIGKVAAQLTHEIRNPLAAMRGSAQLLAGELPPEGTAAKLSRILVRESDRLSRLVEEVLRFSRPPEPVRRDIALGQLVSETVSLLRADPLAKEVELSVVAPEVSASADPDQLRQVLLNLVRNALQAAGPGGLVRVTVEQEPAGARIRVWDSAGSIPMGNMPRLFEPFFTTRDGGTGLGLSLAHSIVAAHGGHIQVTSSPEQGTEFSVRLPRKEAGR